MSGTSLDGLDICYAKFWKENTNWKFEICSAETYPYNDEWRNKLENAFCSTAESLAQLHSEFGFYLGKQVKQFIKTNSIEKIDLIASHGHTVFHNPKSKYTTQIGDGRAIKICTELPTIYDFRTQDVLLGGNGAPLVPIGDELLFSEYDACLNLGGFSNISFKKENKRIAFDICPVNIVLNELSKQLGQEYDEDGLLAKKGTVYSTVLQDLNELPFYHNLPPKSLGKEWVEKYIKPILSELETSEALATFTEHCAIQIATIFNQNRLKTILCTGGGTYNSFLIERIKHHSTSEIIIPDSDIINFKEALIFAFMGVLNKVSENNILSSATGSLQDHKSGIWA